MSKKDKIIQKINYLKFWIGICIALIISVGTWIISNIEKDKTIKFLLALLFFLGVLKLVYKLHRKITKYINSLEDL